MRQHLKGGSEYGVLGGRINRWWKERKLSGRRRSGGSRSFLGTFGVDRARLRSGGRLLDGFDLGV